MKIYDGFLFFNELDLLEIRLNTLNDVVDYFVLVEASVTHSGKSKPYYFEENKEKFSKFLHKIIHLKINDIPDDFSNFSKFEPKNFDEKCVYDIHRFIETANNFNRFTQPHYGRDFYQKECIRRGLEFANDDDIIILSDLDEIPNPEIIMRLNEFYDSNEFYTLNQIMYCYYFNLMCFSYTDNSKNFKEMNANWKGSRFASYSKLKNYSYNLLRVQDNNDVINGGWHFSYMGGKDRVKSKIEASSAIEWNNSNVMSNLESNLNQEYDVINRGDTLIKVQIDDTYPKYFLDNIEKFDYLIKK